MPENVGVAVEVEIGGRRDRPRRVGPHLEAVVGDIAAAGDVAAVHAPLGELAVGVAPEHVGAAIGVEVTVGVRGDQADIVAAGVGARDAGADVVAAGVGGGEFVDVAEVERIPEGIDTGT